MIQKSLTDFPTYPVFHVAITHTQPHSITGIGANPVHKKRVHPNHRMEDNSLRVYFNMVSSGELNGLEQQVIDALEEYPESTAYELNVAAKIPIRTCAALISDIFNDKKHRFPVKPTIPWQLFWRPHYYTKSELIKFRKWTPVAITEFLQYPDETEINLHSDSLNAPPMQLFLANRVWAVEAIDGYKEYQKERKQKRSGGI